jgi:hypothetical protein
MDPVPDELHVQERRLEPVAQLRMPLRVGSGCGESSALAGTRGNANLQASVAAGMQSAGEEGGAAGILGIGIAAGL